MSKYDLHTQQYSVLQHAALGLSVIATAQAMHLSPNTVKSYRTGLLRRLNAVNITHAVSIGYKKGILS